MAIKSILEFNLPDDDYDFKCAINGPLNYAALKEIEQAIRQHRKYEQPIEETVKDIESILNEVNLEL